MSDLNPQLFILPSQISRGGSHSRNYVLRMAGGFGNQFVYVLYRKWSDASQVTWTAKLASRSSHVHAHAWEKQPGYYHYPLQLASSPNSTFISRSPSISNLALLTGLDSLTSPLTPNPLTPNSARSMTSTTSATSIHGNHQSRGRAEKVLYCHDAASRGHKEMH